MQFLPTMGGNSSSESNGERSPLNSSSLTNGHDYGRNHPAPSSMDFGYVEFDGKDGKTCPTCQGTGRISKRQEEELVALIPYNDKRLKPRRTTLYVVLAIITCLLVCGLVLFFILPRSVDLKEDTIKNYSVAINSNTSSTLIILNNAFNITNTNFFHIEVTSIVVLAYFDQIQVGQGKLTHTPVQVPPRTWDFQVNVTIPMGFNKSNQLDFMAGLCKNVKRRVHDIVIKLQATQTSQYLQHSEQNMITVYKYVDCSLVGKEW